MSTDGLKRWQANGRTHPEVIEKLRAFEARLAVEYPAATRSALEMALCVSAVLALNAVLLAERRLLRARGSLITETANLTGALARIMDRLGVPRTVQDEPRGGLDEWAKSRAQRAGNEVEQ
jgi:hypothetical protein